MSSSSWRGGRGGEEVKQPSLVWKLSSGVHIEKKNKTYWEKKQNNRPRTKPDSCHRSHSSCPQHRHCWEMDCLLYDSRVLLETIEKKKQRQFELKAQTDTYFPARQTLFWRKRRRLPGNTNIASATSGSGCHWYDRGIMMSASPSLEKTLIHWNRHTV